MPRGRKPLTPAPKTEIKLSDAALKDLKTPMNETSRRLARIEELYGDDELYRYESCKAKARFYIGQTGEAMLGAGKQLLRIKEHEPHGRFLEALNEIGIAPRASQKLMQATIRFCSPQMRQLTAHLNRTKLLELLNEDEKEIQELAKGGTVAGLTLDDIEHMSSSELRKKLREERKKRRDDKETGDRLIATKDQKLNQLDSELHRRHLLPPDEWERKALKDLADAGSTVRSHLLNVERVIKDIHDREDAPDHMRTACAQQLTLIIKAVWELSGRQLVQFDQDALVEEIWPQWMRGEKDKAAG